MRGTRPADCVRVAEDIDAVTEVLRSDWLTQGQAGPQLGPAITADFPDVLAALAKLAEG